MDTLIKTVSPSTSTSALVTKFKDGIYTISRGDGWIRGNNANDIIGDLILSPGMSGLITRTKECNTTYSFEVLTSATFGSSFVQATLELSLALEEVTGESVEYEYLFTAPANSSLYCRIYQTYFKDEVVTVENGIITNKAIVYTPSGMCPRSLKFIEGTKVNPGILDEPVDRCILGDKLDINSVLDVDNKKEEYKLIPKRYTYKTKLYDSKYKVDLFFTMRSSGMYLIQPEDPKDNIVLYELKTEEFGQVEELVTCYPGNSAVGKGIVCSLDEEKDYVLRIFPSSSSSARRIPVSFRDIDPSSWGILDKLVITHTGQSIGQLPTYYTRNGTYFGLMFIAPNFNGLSMDIRLNRGSITGLLYEVKDDFSMVSLGRVWLSPSRNIIRHGNAGKRYLLVLDRRAAKDSSNITVSITYNRG